MFSIILTACGLGLAGIDPAGAVVGVGLLGMKVPRAHIVIMLATFLAGTVALGTVLSVVLGPRVTGLDWRKFEPSDRDVAFGLVVLGLGLLVWGVFRVRHPQRRKARHDRNMGSGILPLALLGIAFALGSIISPPFLALVVIAGRYDHLWEIILSYTIWVVLNQSPLLIVTGISITPHGKRTVERFRSWWVRTTRERNRIATNLAFIAGGVCLLESVWWASTGSFLIAWRIIGG